MRHEHRGHDGGLPAVVVIVLGAPALLLYGAKQGFDMVMAAQVQHIEPAPVAAPPQHYRIEPAPKRRKGEWWV